MYRPSFNDPFLESIRFSLSKRSKALKHNTQSCSFERVWEGELDSRIEKIEICLNLHDDSRGTRVRLYAWDNGWLWLDARAAQKKGWRWEWSYEGRRLGEFDGRDIVAALEDTISAASFREAGETDDFTEIWQNMLARGPAPVR